MAAKRIPVDSLKVGMYVTRLDCPWYKTPFLRHRFLVRAQSQLDTLARTGIREVTIDPSRGLDIDTPATLISAAIPPASASIPAGSSQESTTPQVQTFQALAEDLRVAREAREKLTESVRTVFERVRSSGIVQNDEVRDLVREIIIVTKTLTNPAAFIAVKGFGQFDPSLSDHALSVCTLALTLGQAAGYTFMPLHNLATSALLHDVGLLQLPRHLWRGARAHSDQARYESHGRLGAVLLERQGFDHDVLRIVEGHHAAASPTGPEQTSPEQQVLEASRIVGVVDRYHELVTGQFDASPYPHLALSRLYQEAQMNRVDTKLVSLFIKTIGVYPVYSLVELNTGERGIVTEIAARQLLRPVVTIIRDKNGNPYQAPVRVDLSSDFPEATARSIVRTLDAEDEGFHIGNLF
ncbi:MAG: DUF3391 domain-containing protein [Nitrospiraceae bacterium]